MINNDQEMKREFGRRLQAERERLGLSVAEFADRVGCAQRCQSDFEQGVLWPYADYVQKAVGLGLDASVLFGVSEPEPQGTGGHSMPEVQESVKNMLALMGKQTDSLEEMLRVVNLMQMFLQLTDSGKKMVEYMAQTIDLSPEELGAFKKSEIRT